jgi:hypothetical protein
MCFCPGFSNKETRGFLISPLEATYPIHPSFIELTVAAVCTKAASREVLGFLIVTVTHYFDQYYQEFCLSFCMGVKLGRLR